MLDIKFAFNVTRLIGLERERCVAFVFLRASAMLKHVIDIGWTSVRPFVRPSVCLSVCPSHAPTVSKLLNVLT